MWHKIILISLAFLLLFVTDCRKKLPEGVVAQEDINADKGGTVETSDGYFMLEIPPHALSNNTTVTIKIVDDPPSYPSLSFIKSNRNCYNVDIGDVTILDSIQVIAVYDDSGYTDENNFSLAYYDTTYDCWTFTGGNIKTSENQISVQTLHLSDWWWFYFVPPTITDKKLDVPYYTQYNCQWCLPTSMAMEMKHFGYDREFYEVATSFGLAPDEGISLFDVIIGRVMGVYSQLTGNTPYRFGFYGGEGLNFVKNVLGNLVQIDRPGVLMSLYAKHGIEITGWSGDSVYFNDPSGYFNAGEVKAVMSWANFRNTIGGLVTWVDAFQLNPMSADKRKGTIQLSALFFGQSALLDLEFDGRYPCGYYYKDWNGTYPDDPNADGYDLQNMPRTTDSLQLECDIANVTSSQQSYQVLVKMYNRSTGSLIGTIKDTTLSVTPYYQRLTVMFGANNSYLLSNLTSGRYTLRVYLLNSTVMQDSFVIHFNLASGGGTNNPPYTPSIPSGPTSGYVDSTYNFSSSTTDPDNDNIAIRFVWADGDTSAWSSYVPSGQTVTMSHSWIAAGTYSVKAQAKDINGGTSNWSSDHQIVISNGTGWNIQTVDTIGSVGSSSSIALDGSGRPHISYSYSTNSDVKYAYWTGSSWNIQTVDATGSVGVGTSIALDGSDRPHISYGDWTDFDLKYAYWTGSSWNIQTVDATGDVGSNSSIALDGSGRPHISYYDFLNYDLKYAYWTGSSWNIQTVDATGDVGSNTSIALDGSGQPHISYREFTYGNIRLKYAYWTGSSWNIQAVDATGDVGYYTSIALDGSGQPHISYYDYTNRNLKYAYWTGSSWNIQTVDATGDVGSNTSIALDGSGQPHISYRDGTNGNLKYAYWTGSSWNIQTVDALGDVGTSSSTSVALDGSGQPHISYGDITNGNLKYAYWISKSW